MHEGFHVLVALLVLAFVVGALTQFLKNPAGANALFAASADTVNGVIHGLEGQPGGKVG